MHESNCMYYQNQMNYLHNWIQFDPLDLEIDFYSTCKYFLQCESILKISSRKLSIDIHQIDQSFFRKCQHGCVIILNRE